MWKKEFKFGKRKKSNSGLQTTEDGTHKNKSAHPNASNTSKEVVQKDFKKSTLSKHINKKSNFMKDTAQSRNNRKLGIEKAKRNKTNSRDRQIYQSQQRLSYRKIKRKVKVDEEEISDIIQLADEFWDNVEQEKKKVKKVTRLTNINVDRNRTPISERTTFAQRMRTTATKKDSKRQIDKHFRHKFKPTLINSQRSRIKI
jgi:hypothetical protein